MPRGEVRWIDIEVPDPVQGPIVLRKMAVRLQLGGSPVFDNSSRLAVVLISTDDYPTDEPLLWEAKFEGQHGIPEPSIVDGRWVFTVDRTDFEQSDFVTQLGTDLMDDIRDAVFAGLDL